MTDRKFSMKDIWAADFFSSIRKKTSKAYSRMPLWLKVISGPLLGGLIGLLGGTAGFFIGLVLGYLIQELMRQFSNDRQIHQYFENSGVSQFNEGESGLAAFCGLGVLVASESSAESSDVAIEEAGRIAKACFPAVSDTALIEHFCRLAWTRRKSLNPDLLLESLISRRGKHAPKDQLPGELSRLGAALFGLASSDTARDFAAGLRQRLDPLYKAPPGWEDPWKILGIPPDTPLPEIKAHYRRLAAQFHPDALQGLDDEHRATAARAFIAIEKAYREVSARVSPE